MQNKADYRSSLVSKPLTSLFCFSVNYLIVRKIQFLLCLAVFYIALNYTSDIQEIAIPDEAEILIGSARLEPAGVVVWKEKSDDRHK